VNVVRVYTVLGPDFYRAIVAWNTARPPAQWIWYFQGVWTPDVELEGPDGYGADAFEPFIDAIMTDFVVRTVRVVHGDGAVRYLATGTGNFDTDASAWCLAWVFGTEWYPFTVNVTDNGSAKGLPPYQGTYLSATATASPFESWLARHMDDLLKLDASFGGWQRPVSFTNWVTTDPIVHPLEPEVPWSSEDWQEVNGAAQRAAQRSAPPRDSSSPRAHHRPPTHTGTHLYVHTRTHPHPCTHAHAHTYARARTVTLCPSLSRWLYLSPCAAYSAALACDVQLLRGLLGQLSRVPLLPRLSQVSAGPMGRAVVGEHRRRHRRPVLPLPRAAPRTTPLPYARVPLGGAAAGACVAGTLTVVLAERAAGRNTFLRTR
jgi:hypothetical protein